MDSNQSHDQGDTSNALNDVDKADLTKTLFSDFNEPVLPLLPLASEPHSYSHLLGGQPSSFADVPPFFERTDAYSNSILGLDGVAKSHSASHGLRHPTTALPDQHELPRQERVGNVLLDQKENLHAAPSVNGPSDGGSGSEFVPPPSYEVNGNPRQLEEFGESQYVSETSPNQDKTTRNFNGRDLSGHAQIETQPQSNSPFLVHNTTEVQDAVYPHSQPHMSRTTERLHAARVLQNMMETRRGDVLVTSSQQLQFHDLPQLNQPNISAPASVGHNSLKGNNINPIWCTPRPQIMPNSLPDSESHSQAQPNSPNFPNHSDNTRSLPNPALQNVGNNNIEGSAFERESQLLERNSLSRSTVKHAGDSKVLPDTVVDPALFHKASILEKGLYKTAEFEVLCEIEREKNEATGKAFVGGTVKRTHALIKPIANLDKFGYPACDGPQLQEILDIIPGLDRDGVEYLKLTALSQLDRIRRGAREALHQLSTILVDQLRFRIMTQTDILELQCKVVDRFVVARNCVLERYSHYVKSRTWIENMSTNQRRRCLSHQQNNILRMWLYQNFKNPYPDEEEKAYIVEETRLTMEQVNNWFINARSRFWKPATDFLYRESLETKMSALTTLRLKMTPEDRAEAAKSTGSASI